MGKLIYSAIASLDGYIADEQGDFDWAEPAADVHAYVNELARNIGTFLLGRRMYEVMLAWETMDAAGQPPVIDEFARIWRAADKIVYSTTLTEPSTSRTRVATTFDPNEVRRMKAQDHDLGIGGPGLATHAFEAGLIDEVQLCTVPVIVGGGTRVFPDAIRVDLDLTGERRFGDGVVYLGYDVR